MGGKKKCQHDQLVTLTEYGTCRASSLFREGKLDRETPNGGLVADINGIFAINCHVCGFTRKYNRYQNKHIPQWVLDYYEKNASGG